MEEFRKWLEMSMDFSQVDDPFEPEFYKSAVNRKKMAVVYHGTSTDHFWSIINNGFVFNPDKKNWDNTTPGIYWSFDLNRTKYYSYRAVQKGGEEMVIVAELPISMLQPDPDDSATFDRDTKFQAFSKENIPSKYITGVIYPFENNTAETPIRKFIQQVNKGKILAIPPQEMPNQKFKRATPDDMEIPVVDMLVSLVQYTNMAHHITDHQTKFVQKVLTALHEMKWQQYSGWNGVTWAKWLEKLFGEDAGDLSNIEQYYNRPTYILIKQHTNHQEYQKYRLGKKNWKPKLY